MSNFLAYLGLAAAVCFILALKGLSHPKTAQRGNTYAMVGMGTAITMALVVGEFQNLILIIPALIIGAAIGIPVAKRISLTSLPQLVALFHSFVGLAATFIALVVYLHKYPIGLLHMREGIELSLGAAIGILTFTGSILAALKL